MSPVGTLAQLFLLLASFERSALAISQTEIDAVNANCRRCDDQFTKSIIDYQQSYGKTWSTSLAAAKYFCGQFDLVRQCYVDCLGGASVTYLSVEKQQFSSFYATNCDPVCYGTAVPWCYMKYVGQFSLGLSCDTSTRSLKNNLRVCLIEELFYKQQCNGSCTPGQRKANFMFMQLQSQCLIPLNAKDDCFNWIQYCIGNYYGDSGVDFALYSDASMQQNNSLSCNFYHTSFESCMQQSVNGKVTLGLAPSETTYQAPCTAYQVQIDFLSFIENTRLTYDFCQNPSLSINDTCSASGSAVTRTKSQPVTTSTATTPVQAKTPGQPNVGAPSLSTGESTAAAITTSSVQATASPSGQPSIGAPSLSIGQPVVTMIATSPVQATEPVGQPDVGAPSSPATSELLSQTTVGTSTTKLITTTKNLLDGFFDLPPTTPEPTTTTTTRKPRPTFSFDGGALGGGDLFNGPTTSAGATDGNAGDETDQSPTFGTDDDGQSVTTPRSKRLRLLIGDSSSIRASQPACLIIALMLSYFLIAHQPNM